MTGDGARFLARAVVAVALCRVGCTTHAQGTPRLRAAWADLETWSRRLDASQENEIGVGFQLEGERGTVLLAVTSRTAGQQPDQPPDELTLQAAISDRASPNVVPRPALSLLVDDGAGRHETIDLTPKLAVDNPVPGARIRNGLATISAAEFLKLAGARTLSANVFGFVVGFRTDQVAALSAFATRVHLQPAAHPQRE